MWRNFDRGAARVPKGLAPLKDAAGRKRKAAQGLGNPRAAEQINSTRLSSTTTADQQHLIAAGFTFRTLRNMSVVGCDQLADAGMGLDYDLPGELDDTLADLRLIVSGRASVADLREPGLPAWAVEPTIRWREERDQRGTVPAREPAARPVGAAQSTVDAITWALCNRGEEALTDPDNIRRLDELSQRQCRSLAATLEGARHRWPKLTDVLLRELRELGE